LAAKTFILKIIRLSAIFDLPAFKRINKTLQHSKYHA